MRDKRKTALAFGMGCLLAASIAMAQDSPLASFPDKHVWFGDLHLHTSNSYDAASASVKTTPRDSYRYAQGYPVDYFGHQVKRKAPLDFLAPALVLGRVGFRIFDHLIDVFVTEPGRGLDADLLLLAGCLVLG